MKEEKEEEEEVAAALGCFYVIAGVGEAQQKQAMAPASDPRPPRWS